ncbi:MAG: hypothetical protein IPM98_03650 [Lewinellaceae bacterium]|nr:hypothetical protein [Lewinellaceae bacterium]
MCLSVQSVQAQFSENRKSLEVGIGAYATNYSGDIAPDPVSTAQTRVGAGTFVRLHLNNFFQVRGQLFAGRLAGDDKNHAPNAGRQVRFSTTVLEGSVLLEGSLGIFKYEPVTSNITYHFVPYLFAGAGAARVDARASYYGPEDKRDRLLKEPFPEGGESTHVLLVTPFGMGLRVIAGDRLGCGFEMSARPVYSDLLDGVSRNGNPGTNDWYYTLGVSISYFIGKPWRVSN